MATWQQFDPGDLFPQAMSDAIESLETTSEILGQSLDTAADIVDLVSNFIVGLIDVNTALIEAAQALVDSVTQAILSTGVFMLEHIPDSPILRVTPELWLQQVSLSLDDPFDENRPILIDPGAFVGGIVTLAVAPDYRDLMSLYKALFDLFNSVTASLDQLTNMVLPGETPPAFIPGTARDPNWESVTVAKLVPGIGVVAEELQKFSKAVSAARTGSDIYAAFAQALRTKADSFLALGQALSQELLDLADALDFSGVWLLSIYGQGDKVWLQDQLTNTPGGPLALGGSQFAAGYMFLASGGTTTPRDVLFDLFGLEKA